MKLISCNSSAIVRFLRFVIQLTPSDRNEWKQNSCFLFKRKMRAIEMRMEVIRFMWMGLRFLRMGEGV